jgi:PASTA domain-containing protein
MMLWAFAATAAAEPLPPYDGTMTFQSIEGPDGPEDFSWEVKLDEEVELREIDNTHAGVYWVGTETLAMTITAQLAHDAVGTNVPTTLAVTQPNIVTLTVHHRSGNPTAGGAPFDYPVIAGAGWEGGFQQHTVDMGPPTEQAPTPPVPRCTVPDLTGRTLKAARRHLRRSHCGLGEVRGERSRGARVLKQFRQPGKSLPAGTEVDVKLTKVAYGKPATS